MFCCLCVMNVVQLLIDVIFKKFYRSNYTKDKKDKKMNSLNERQYIVLKQLKDYQKQRISSSGCKDLDNIILHNDFYENINLEDFQVNTILKELHDIGYIYDVACAEPQFTKVHTCKINDKGLDALKNYQESLESEIKDKKDDMENQEFKAKIKNLVPDFVNLVIKIINKIVGIYIIITIIENL